MEVCEQCKSLLSGLTVISGGATGADMAALETAESFGIKTQGHVHIYYAGKEGDQDPEALQRMERFNLQFIDRDSYKEKDKCNVQDADVVVCFYQGDVATGTYKEKTSAGALQTAFFALKQDYSMNPALIKEYVDDMFEKGRGFSPVSEKSDDGTKVVLLIPIVGSRFNNASWLGQALLHEAKTRQYKLKVMFSGPTEGGLEGATEIVRGYAHHALSKIVCYQRVEEPAATGLHHLCGATSEQ